MEINTNRLYIRNLRESDWTEMKHIFSDFNRSKYAIYDAALPITDTEVKKLTKRFAETNLFFAVFLKEAPHMAGYVCFHKDKDAYDLGYCFHSAYQGKGFAFESCEALMLGFKEQYGARVFTAGTAINNIPSCKLLKKLGFVCVSTETLSFHKDSVGNDILFEGGNFVCRIME